MASNHLILCRPHLLPPSTFPMPHSAAKKKKKKKEKKVPVTIEKVFGLLLD